MALKTLLVLISLSTFSDVAVLFVRWKIIDLKVEV